MWMYLIHANPQENVSNRHVGHCYAGSDTLYILALPRATVFEYELIQDLAGKFVANSMDVYA